MTRKLKRETFSQKIEHSGGVIVLPLTPLFSFVTFHLKSYFVVNRWKSTISTFPILIEVASFMQQEEHLLPSFYSGSVY